VDGQGTLGDVLVFARSVAVEAGDRLLARLGRLTEGDVTYKGRVDLVTAADREVESFLTGRIAAVFPDDGFRGEEGATRAGSSGRVWIIDPLDGTTNYVHGFPFFGVSIALEDRGVIELGVVHAPMLGETFSARRGRGATLNGTAIHVSRTDELVRALLATGFAYDRTRPPLRNLAEFGRLTVATQGVRRAGAAALDLAYVASGRLDGFWEFGLKPWDVAAGVCLVREAGGRVTGIDGGADFLETGEVAATNGILHDRLLEALAGTDGVTDE
jgi:myo-inositol-1(or 4)-monophosphatase